MAKGFTWKQKRTRAEDKATSLQLRRDMMAQEKELQGTFKQKSDREDSRVGLKGKQDRLTQALQNKGSAATQTIATVGAGKRQDSENAIKLKEIAGSQGYYDATAKLRTAQARGANVAAQMGEIALPYAERKARKGVNLPLKGAGPGRKSYEATRSEIDNWMNGASTEGKTTVDAALTDNLDNYGVSDLFAEDRKKKRKTVEWDNSLMEINF